jgi:hypothetical protein
MIKQLKIVSSKEKVETRSLYDTLYNFSLHKLNVLAMNKALNAIFELYFNLVGADRID